MNNTQVFTYVNSTRSKNDPEEDLQAEQAVYQLEGLTGSSFHQGSSSNNQLELSQLQDQSKALLTEDQENWTEEYEEEQV